MVLIIYALDGPISLDSKSSTFGRAPGPARLLKMNNYVGMPSGD
jgi:hypothetical protein